MTIGLILHIGYVSEIPWIMDQFKAVEQHPEFTIVTILDQDFRDPTATQAIQQAVQFFSTWPHIQILPVENRGYDIGPFLTAMHVFSKLLKKPDVIVKLHTKRDLQVRTDNWSGLKQFSNVQQYFETHPDVNMVVSSRSCLACRQVPDHNEYYISEICRQLSISKQEELQMTGMLFPNATMFAARTACFMPYLDALQSIPLNTPFSIDAFWYVQPWVHYTASKQYSSQFSSDHTGPVKTMAEFARDHYVEHFDQFAPNPSALKVVKNSSFFVSETSQQRYCNVHRNGAIEHAMERVLAFLCCFDKSTFCQARFQLLL